MISIICVYNNKKLLDNYLLKSLENQTVAYELILLDNSKNKFMSAAEALNYGGKKAKCEYLMFAHQDIYFDSTFLERAEMFLNSSSKLGMAGLAGSGNSKHPSMVLSNIIQENFPSNLPKAKNKTLEKLQTVDECILFVSKSVFSELKFDEQICDNWHLYGVDYCLEVLKKNLSVYLLPLTAYHLSYGYISKEYDDTLYKLIKKHKNTYKLIYTTVGTFNTHLPFKIQKNWIFRWKLRKMYNMM